MEDFGQIVRRRRLELGLTQRELAPRVGMSHQMLSVIEKGGTTTTDKMAALSAELGIDMALAAGTTHGEPRHAELLARVGAILARASEDDLDAFVGQVSMWERALGIER